MYCWKNTYQSALISRKFPCPNKFQVACLLSKHCLKVVRIRSFSGPHFSAFGLNTGRYEVSLRIQYKCRKIGTRITPKSVTFHAVKVAWLALSISWLKVSEYPFKQNKNMLKKKAVLLYTYFYNISLNVLRPTFANICNLPFLQFPNIGKIRVKVGPKTRYFSSFMSSCTTELQFSIIFFHWYVAN